MRTATHLVKTTQEYCACHTKRPSARDRTGWNVTKCRACHAKRHDNLLGNLRKGEVLQLPPKTRRGHRKTRYSRRDTWEHQNEHFVRDFLQFSNLVASKSTFSYEFSYEPLNLLYLKIDVSCEASANFHHISQNATLATEFAPCRHLTQPWQCDPQKARNATHLKCCGCHAKWRWTRPKCCACHENCNSSCENVAKVLRMPHRTTFESHACHAKRSYAALETSKSDPFAELTIGPDANGCELLRTVANINATSSEHTLNLQTPRVKREPLLRIQEKSMSRSHVNPCQTGDARNFFAQWKETIIGPDNPTC